jgi:signal peptidase I
MPKDDRNLEDIFSKVDSASKPQSRATTIKPHQHSAWLSLVVGTTIFLYDIFKTVTTVLGIAFLIRFFLIQPFYISGSSMEPTFENNQYIIVDQISPHFRPYERGEVIVFRYPNNVAFQYIKRVIGLPGDMVKIQDNKIYIYNQAHPDGAVLAENYTQGVTAPHFQSATTFTVPPDEYFVMGDNRQHSEDSRDFGPVKRSLIIGRVWVRLYPFNQFAVLGRPIYGQGL